MSAFRVSGRDIPHITAAEGEAVEDGAGAEQEVINIFNNNINILLIIIISIIIITSWS